LQHALWKEETLLLLNPHSFSIAKEEVLLKTKKVISFWRMRPYFFNNFLSE